MLGNNSIVTARKALSIFVSARGGPGAQNLRPSGKAGTAVSYGAAAGTLNFYRSRPHGSARVAKGVKTTTRDVRKHALTRPSERVFALQDDGKPQSDLHFWPCVALLLMLSIISEAYGQAPTPTPTLISFTSGDLVLKGFIWKPEGEGPFPSILWNHGSERLPGPVDTVAPEFVRHGYVFFVPHRRGQGRSPGTYIMDQLNEATSPEQRSGLLVTLNEAHFQDQISALAFLKAQPYVDPIRLFVMGASFGGIQTILAVEHGGYRAAVDCSGAAQTWKASSDIRSRLIAAARHAKMPVFLFQAKNDYELSPNRILSEAIRTSGNTVESKVYPAFGSTAQDGHTFCWRGTKTWAPDVLEFIKANMKSLQPTR
jgi:carboxymethylenebutenolidase